MTAHSTNVSGASGAGGYRELNDPAYTKFRRSLLADKGGDEQVSLLEAASSNEALVDHLSNRVPTEGSARVPLFGSPLSESEFLTPPADTERSIYRAWRSISPRVACRTVFWARVTLDHVRAGRIQSTFLARPITGTDSGAAVMEMALASSGDARPKKIDACVRNILRRLGGIPEVRGSRTVYVNCPMARAWWRELIVDQVADGDKDVARGVRGVVRRSNNYWEKIVDRIVSRVSTFGDADVRRAFILALSQRTVDARAGRGSTKELQQACRRLAARQATRELGILNRSELDAVMYQVLGPTDTEHST